MEAGFTAIEALIGIFAFAVLSLGTISLAVVGMRMVIDSERRVVALALVNERIEFIRSQPYEQIDYPPAPGALEQVKKYVRNKQPYDLETQVTPTPDGLQKQIEVTASWLAPAGGRRDVQVVTLVSKESPQNSEQKDCIPENSSGSVAYKFKTDNFLDNAFTQAVNDCSQPALNLPVWQCCAWSVQYNVDATLTDVTGTYSCAKPPSLPKPPTDHPAPGSDNYTKLARECSDGTRCGPGKQGFLYCDANCLKEPGNCVCVCT